MHLITSAQQREIDRLAAAEYALPARVLMETAGRAVAREALALCGPAGRVAVVCGGGGNGGDGYVAARFLREAGRLAMCGWAVDPSTLSGPAREAYDAFAAPFRILAQGRGRGAGDGVAPIERGDLWAFARAFPGSVTVDAIFGTGLSRAPDGDAARAIEAIAKARLAGAKVLSVDVPSGLRADDGALFSSHVEADMTLTFGFSKRGLAIFPGAGAAGRVVVEPLGLVPELTERVLGASPRCELLEEADVRRVLRPRSPTAHKNDFGHVLIIAGGPGKTGAAQLCALGALHAGAGLVTLAAPPEVLAAATPGAPEVMGFYYSNFSELEKSLPMVLAEKSVIAIGPGLSPTSELAEFVAKLLAIVSPEVPIVLDADALNALALDRSQLAAHLRAAASPPVLTPHPGELARLTGESITALEADRLGAAGRAAQTWNAHVLFKGARTVIADPDGRLAINPTGNAGMATAGSGDVLTGIVAALLGRRGGASRSDRVRAAAFVHGAAGDRLVARTGQAGLTASAMARELGDVWRAWNL